MINVSYQMVNNYMQIVSRQNYICFFPRPAGMYLLQVSFSMQVLCVKADRVPTSGPVRTIAEGH